MGIIIGDTITLPSGLTVQNAYAGFSSNLVTVTPTTDPSSPTGKSYVVQAPYNIWVSDEARQAGRDPLMVKQLQFKMGAESLNAGVYTVLYTQMCKAYTNFTNTDQLPASQSGGGAGTTSTAAPSDGASSQSASTSAPAASDTSNSAAPPASGS